MTWERLRLQHRIVIPFALAALLAMSAAALVARSLIARALESRVHAQVLSASLVVSRSDFALNAAILGTVKEITGAEVITYTQNGAVLASTLDSDRNAALVTAITGSAATASALESTDGAAVVEQMLCDGVPCYAAYRPVTGRPGAVVAVVAGMSEVAAATSATTRTILLAVVLSLVALVLVSQFVARRVTGPLDRLVSFARDVPADPSPRRAPVGDDEIGRLAAAFNDMLDRLGRSREALVRSEKLALAGLLAARIAHDIRNPLSSIKMQAQLLRAQLQGDEESRATLGAILRDIDQVESVILDLLELARPGELRRQRVSLNDVVRDALRQMEPQFAHHKIGVDTAFDRTLPAVGLDVSRFKQAVINIVTNAVEAMTTGGTLGVATRPDSESTILLDICDDGVGIAPDLIDRVFDPFVSTKRQGVGLGLVNAKAVVESHGGRLELTPLQPRGTCARILLPLSYG